MRTWPFRRWQFVVGMLFLSSLVAVRESPAQSQSRGEPGQSEKIVIPPEEFEKGVKRFNFGELTPEEAIGITGFMSKSREGFVPPVPAPSIPPETGVAPQITSVFPQIPPAVAGTREALGRWMMFQAELLSKLAKSYAAYGGELLQQSSQGTPPKPATQTKGK